MPSVDPLVTRRRLLQVGALSGLGLTLPRLLQTEAQAVGKSKAKSCIFLYLNGGPSQLDTFD